MKKFNKTKAEELVIQFTKTHIEMSKGLNKEYNNTFYRPSGSVLETNKVLNEWNNYDFFYKKLRNFVWDNIPYTKSSVDWWNRNNTQLIKEAGMSIGGCYFEGNQYTKEVKKVELVWKDSIGFDRIGDFEETILFTETKNY
jgi:hypothetical protein